MNFVSREALKWSIKKPFNISVIHWVRVTHVERETVTFTMLNAVTLRKSSSLIGTKEQSATDVVMHVETAVKRPTLRCVVWA
jgi:hypothetical protein